MKFLCPAKEPIEIRRRLESTASDVFGDVEEFSAWEPALVYFWNQVSSSEPKLVGTDRVVVDLEVGAPFGLSDQDEFRLPDGREFSVVGSSEDMNHGPFDFRPGFVINGRHVRG